MILQRIIDIVFSIIFIIILSPIFLLIFFINSIDGTPFFVQSRLGKKGKEIKVTKFRSMKVNAEEILKSDKKLYKLYVDNNFKIPNKIDPRITRFGNFLRKSSIDEIPQFFNVLKGDMSIVGPRPIVKDELKNYSPSENLFLSVKPGITGLWQVSGRSTLTHKSRVNLDLDYIKRKNIFLDLYIILKTPIKILKREGAY